MWNMRTKPVVLERLQYAKKIFGTAAGWSLWWDCQVLFLSEKINFQTTLKPHLGWLQTQWDYSGWVPGWFGLKLRLKKPTVKNRERRASIISRVWRMKMKINSRHLDAVTVSVCVWVNFVSVQWQTGHYDNCGNLNPCWCWWWPFAATACLPEHKTWRKMCSKIFTTKIICWILKQVKGLIESNQFSLNNEQVDECLL